MITKIIPGELRLVTLVFKIPRKLFSEPVIGNVKKFQIICVTGNSHTHKGTHTHTQHNHTQHIVHRLWVA